VEWSPLPSGGIIRDPEIVYLPDEKTGLGIWPVAGLFLNRILEVASDREGVRDVTQQGPIARIL
jgi:hypothetical protein